LSWGERSFIRRRPVPVEFGSGNRRARSSPSPQSDRGDLQVVGGRGLLSSRQGPWHPPPGSRPYGPPTTARVELPALVPHELPQDRRVGVDDLARGGDLVGVRPAAGGHRARSRLAGVAEGDDGPGPRTCPDVGQGVRADEQVPELLALRDQASTRYWIGSGAGFFFRAGVGLRPPPAGRASPARRPCSTSSRSDKGLGARWGNRPCGPSPVLSLFARAVRECPRACREHAPLPAGNVHRVDSGANRTSVNPSHLQRKASPMTKADELDHPPTITSAAGVARP